MQPLVSIIMPAYNGQKYIAQSIESVLAQTYTNFELLITDDRSTDQTIEIINRYMDQDARIDLAILPKNSGAGVARNNSIERAKGRYIAFLDSDDLWAVDKLEKQISFMIANNVALSFTGYQKFDDDKLLGVVIPPTYTTYKKLLNGNVIGCLTAVYDSHLIGKQYMPSIRKRQDMGMWLNILKKVPKAYSLPQNLAKYRVSVGMSSNKLEILKWQWRLYREVENLPIFASIKHFLLYALNGYVKYKT